MTAKQRMKAEGRRKKGNGIHPSSFTLQPSRRGKGRTCSCQALGAIRPECLHGVIGWLDAGGVRRFDPLSCAFDAGRVLDAPPRHHGADPQCIGHYKKGKLCSDCGHLISDNSTGRCRTCSSQINGAKSKGGPTNEAWRTSMGPRRKQTA